MSEECTCSLACDYCEYGGMCEVNCGEPCCYHDKITCDCNPCSYCLHNNELSRIIIINNNKRKFEFIPFLNHDQCKCMELSNGCNDCDEGGMCKVNCASPSCDHEKILCNCNPCEFCLQNNGELPLKKQKISKN